MGCEKLPLTEERIKKLHALIEKGPRARPTPYRTGQNVIRDSSSGAIVYMPPEAKDVPSLMLALVEWYKITEYDEIPVPLTAALVHYQFVTIHPYYDGNGRTARILATFILHRGGYGLNGFFSLEEYHDRNISDYYNALSVHPHHNYYEGRSNTDLTPWVEYFIELLSSVFNVAREEAVSNSDKDLSQEPAALRRLDPRARRVLGLFLKKERIISADVAGILGISKRMARVLLKRWTEDGWLKVADPSRKGRSYILSAIYRQYLRNIKFDRKMFLDILVNLMEGQAAVRYFIFLLRAHLSECDLIPFRYENGIIPKAVLTPFLAYHRTLAYSFEDVYLFVGIHESRGGSELGALVPLFIHQIQNSSITDCTVSISRIHSRKTL